MTHPLLYSDPYLNALGKEFPELFEELFQVLVKSEFAKEIAFCLEAPSWALREIGIEGCRHPNFPKESFQEIIERALTQERVENFWIIFASPNLNKEQIESFFDHTDSNVRGLALGHKYGNTEKLISYLTEIFKEPNKMNPAVIDSIVTKAPLTDNLFNFLFENIHIEIHKSHLGVRLLRNADLTDAQRVQLSLAGVSEPELDGTENFWGSGHRLHLSSISLLPTFSAYVGYDNNKKIQSLKGIPTKIVQSMLGYGHPYSLLIAGEDSSFSKVSLQSLEDLIKPLFFQRLFWRELCEQPDFSLYRRNAYRTDDMFISHPILGAEFEDADIESATGLGGVINFDDSILWLSGSSELPLSQAIFLLTNGESYEQLTEIVEERELEYTNLGASLVALTHVNNDLMSKYGFKLLDVADGILLDEAESYAESDDYEVDVEFNSYFQEMISWRLTSESNKHKIFELLTLGLHEPTSKLRNDCVHFMGCMALHQDTPQALLNKLSTIDEPLIQKVLGKQSIL